MADTCNKQADLLIIVNGAKQRKFIARTFVQRDHRKSFGSKCFATIGQFCFCLIVLFFFFFLNKSWCYYFIVYQFSTIRLSIKSENVFQSHISSLRMQTARVRRNGAERRREHALYSIKLKPLPFCSKKVFVLFFSLSHRNRYQL